jgi:hypothetical protein
MRTLYEHEGFSKGVGNVASLKVSEKAYNNAFSYTYNKRPYRARIGLGVLVYLILF